MFLPSWHEGCSHCPFWADNFDGIPAHLNRRDVSFVAVSHARYEQIAAYRRRMGWTFDWVSSAGSDFNYDFGVSFTAEQLANRTAVYNHATSDPASTTVRVSASSTAPTAVQCSIRIRRTRVASTCSTAPTTSQRRSPDPDLIFLDLAPKARDEPGHDSPQYGVRRHDEYRAVEPTRSAPATSLCDAHPGTARCAACRWDLQIPPTAPRCV
jgi:predicted dithiol-disulfide oxidoreductase (DUF899 family)